MVEGDAYSVSRQSASAEAPGLLPLLEDGNTVEEIRELIAVPAGIEKRLREFAAAFPEEGPASSAS